MACDVSLSEKIEELALQMEFRLSEGVNEAIYVIGVEEDGSTTGITKMELGNVSTIGLELLDGC